MKKILLLDVMEDKSGDFLVGLSFVDSKERITFRPSKEFVKALNTELDRKLCGENLVSARMALFLQYGSMCSICGQG